MTIDRAVMISLAEQACETLMNKFEAEQPYGQLMMLNCSTWNNHPSSYTTCNSEQGGTIFGCSTWNNHLGSWPLKVDVFEVRNKRGCLHQVGECNARNHKKKRAGEAGFPSSAESV